MQKNLNLPEDLINDLEELARSDGKSFLAEVVQGLRFYVDSRIVKSEEESNGDSERKQDFVTVTRNEVTLSKRPDTPYQVYSIMRRLADGTLDIGYVGSTSATAESRMQQHLLKLKAFDDPFLQWMYEGVQDGSLEYGVIETIEGYNAARNEEQKLIRRLKPRFNKVNVGPRIEKRDMSYLLEAPKQTGPDDLQTP